MEDSQLLKGVLEGCVLAIIARGETYGYEILSHLQAKGFSELLEGTLYPVLTRLEKRGCITCRRAKSPFGPARKYYTISPKGIEDLELFRQSYALITQAAIGILEENEQGE